MAPGGWDGCPAAPGPVLCEITSAVAFISITLEGKGKIPQKDNVYYFCSQGAMLSLSHTQNARCFSSFAAKYLCYK